MAMGGENVHARWEWSHEVRIAIQGEKWPCKAKMPTQGENGHASHLVKF